MATKELLLFLLVCVFNSEADPSWFNCSASNRLPPGLTGRAFASGLLWPNAIVKFQLDASLNTNNLAELARAFNEFETKTCIIFQPRTVADSSYTVIRRKADICGESDICRTGGVQHTSIGYYNPCSTSPVMIHELGHTLCMIHEHQRPDRDDWVSYSGCPANQIPMKFGNEILTRGHFYDYTSQMHYQCLVCPAGGWPKTAGITRCGIDTQNGLSIMDVDKLNDMYECGECLRHRWRRYESLTEDDKRNMPAFGMTSQGSPVYLCRAYVNGEMTPGKCRLDYNACFLPSNGKEVTVSGPVQIFTTPIPKNTRGTVVPKKGEYKLLYGTIYKSDYLPVGSTPDGETIYAAVAYISGEQAIGKVYAYDMTIAWIPYGGSEVAVKEFQIVGCQ